MKFGYVFFYLCSSVLICGSTLFSSGCDQSSSPTESKKEIVLYTSVDQPYAEPIVRAFERKSGLKVRLVTDTEANKSVGLTERVRAEKDRPQCDVWWGNEPFNTINLAQEGLLLPYESPAGKDVPAMFKDPQHRWTGNALRVRVIGIDPKWHLSRLKEPLYVLEALSRAEFKDRIAMARPTAGTTGGHVAALYVLWGEAKADAYFKSLHDNGVKLLGGNGPVAAAVGNGSIDLGLTDNDDVAAVAREGGKIVAELPDQDTFGTLAIPTTVGLVQDSPAARQLVDYLLSPDVEKQLLDAKFAYAPVRGEMTFKPMQVDYNAVAKAMPMAIRRVTAILEGRE